MASYFPKVSIITATFNSGKYVEDAIKSIIGQTYPHIEYIIVDGGSTDDTLLIVNKYRSEVSALISEPDNGIYDAFNKGINLSSGDIIYFLNSDDYLYDENVIEEIARIFSNDKTLSVVYGNIIMLDEKTGFYCVKGNQTNLQNLKEGNMCPHPGFFAKKELYVKHGSFDTRYRSAGDFDFIVKCFKTDHQDSLYVDRIISVYRLGGMCNNLNTKKIGAEETRQIVKEHFGIELKRLIGESDVHLLYKMWLENFLFEDKNISAVLKTYGIRNAAVFGTMKTALYLMADLEKSNINIVSLLDNNIRMQGRTVRNVKVNDPKWLLDNKAKVDAVILSIESDNDVEVKAQVNSLLKDDKTHIFSWKDIVLMNQKR